MRMAVTMKGGNVHSAPCKKRPVSHSGGNVDPVSRKGCAPLLYALLSPPLPLRGRRGLLGLTIQEPAATPPLLLALLLLILPSELTFRKLLLLPE